MISCVDGVVINASYFGEGNLDMVQRGVIGDPNFLSILLGSTETNDRFTRFFRYPVDHQLAWIVRTMPQPDFIDARLVCI